MSRSGLCPSLGHLETRFYSTAKTGRCGQTKPFGFCSIDVLDSKNNFGMSAPPGGIRENGMFPDFYFFYGSFDQFFKDNSTCNRGHGRCTVFGHIFKFSSPPFFIEGIYVENVNIAIFFHLNFFSR